MDLVDVLGADLLSAESQRAVLQYCDLGDVTSALRSVARVVYSSGIGSRSMPAPWPRGLDTWSQAWDSALELARAYHQAGGVLVAKGFVTPHELASSVMQIWAKASPGDTTRAQAVSSLARELRSWLEAHYGTGDVVIEKASVEVFCRGAATLALGKARTL